MASTHPLFTTSHFRVFTACFLRNMYVDEEGEQLVNEAGEHTPAARAGARWLAEYLRSQVAHLRALPAEDVLKGRFTWADIQPPA